MQVNCSCSWRAQNSEVGMYYLESFSLRWGVGWFFIYQPGDILLCKPWYAQDSALFTVFGPCFSFTQFCGPISVSFISWVPSSPDFIQPQSHPAGKTCWADADLQLMGETFAEPQLPKDYSSPAWTSVEPFPWGYVGKTVGSFDPPKEEIKE